jgi:hypothetical protein
LGGNFGSRLRWASTRRGGQWSVISNPESVRRRAGESGGRRAESRHRQIENLRYFIRNGCGGPRPFAPRFEPGRRRPGSATGSLFLHEPIKAGRLSRPSVTGLFRNWHPSVETLGYCHSVPSGHFESSGSAQRLEGRVPGVSIFMRRSGTRGTRPSDRRSPDGNCFTG